MCLVCGQALGVNQLVCPKCGAEKKASELLSWPILGRIYRGESALYQNKGLLPEDITSFLPMGDSFRKKPRNEVLLPVRRAISERIKNHIILELREYFE